MIHWRDCTITLGKELRTPGRCTEHQGFQPYKRTLQNNYPDQLLRVLETFKMKLLKLAKTALNQQIREAIDIASDTSENILNLKLEYDACILPSLSVKAYEQ